MKRHGHNNVNRATLRHQSFNRRETRRAFARQDETNHYNAIEFINEHPLRLAAYAKQQRDTNARRAKALARRSL